MFSPKAQRKELNNFFPLVHFFSILLWTLNTIQNYNNNKKYIKRFLSSLHYHFPYEKIKIDKYYVKAFTSICTEFRLTKFSFSEKKTGFSAFVHTHTNIAHQRWQWKMCKNKKQGHFIFGYDVIANFIRFISYIFKTTVKLSVQSFGPTYVSSLFSWANKWPTSNELRFSELSVLFHRKFFTSQNAKNARKC